VCDQIAQNEWLASRHVTAIPESRADAAAAIDAAYAMFGLSALVMTPSFVASGSQEDGQVPGNATVVVQVAEIPAINRASAGHATALAAAQRIGIAGSVWAGARLTNLAMVDLKDLTEEEAVAYQATIEISILLTNED
jgi:hypothetical protein